MEISVAEPAFFRGRRAWKIWKKNQSKKLIPKLISSLSILFIFLLVFSPFWENFWRPKLFLDGPWPPLAPHTSSTGTFTQSFFFRIQLFTYNSWKQFPIPLHPSAPPKKMDFSPTFLSKTIFISSVTLRSWNYRTSQDSWNFIREFQGHGFLTGSVDFLVLLLLICSQ